MKKNTLFLIPAILLFIGASCTDQFIVQSRASALGGTRSLKKEESNNDFVIANINDAPWSEGRSVILRNEIPKRYSLMYSLSKIEFTTPETWTVLSRFTDVTVNQAGLATIDFERIDPESGMILQTDGVSLQPNAATISMTLLNGVNPDNTLQYAYARNNLTSDTYIPYGTGGSASIAPTPTAYKKTVTDGRQVVWVEYADSSQKDAAYIDVLIDAGSDIYLMIQFHFGNNTEAEKIHDEINQFLPMIKIQAS